MTIEISTVSTEAGLASLKILLRDYAEYLRDVLGVEHICSAQYEQELQSLPEPYCVLLLAKVNGEPAGCVLLKRLAEPFACEMKRLWVEPQFRRLGLGRRLVRELLQAARKLEFRYIYLDTVTTTMREAQTLYASLGFEPVDRYNDSSVPGVGFFRLSLSSVGY